MESYTVVEERRGNKADSGDIVSGYYNVIFKIMNIMLPLILALFSAIAVAEGIGNEQSLLRDLGNAALERTKHEITYDGSYFFIPYPNGDIPANLGVCTDVVIRSYRSVGIDLQQAVHEDISNNFDAYPSKRLWGLKSPDKNIDHRRVPNLRVFFQKHGETLSIRSNSNDYFPGDLVTWILPGQLPHIGIVTDKRSYDGKRPLIVHNIGSGTKLEDMLFSYKITGHYRYTGN